LILDTRETHPTRLLPPLIVLPAVKAAVFLALGIAAGYWIDIGFPTLACLAASFLILSWFASRLPRGASTATGFALIGLVAAGAASIKAVPMERNFRPVRLIAQVEVLDQPVQRSRGYSFPARIVDVSSSPKAEALSDRKVWLHLSGLKEAPKLGERLSVSGTLSSHPSRRNPGDFELASYRTRHGFIGLMNGRLRKTSSDSISIKAPDRLARLRYDLQNGIHRLSSDLGEPHKALWKSLLIGYRSHLDPALTRDLQDTGLSHLLALSGLHVGFMTAIFYLTGGLLRLPPARRGALALLFLWIYLWLIPDRGSTLRAGLMASFLVGGIILKRWTPTLNALGAAGMFLLILRPGELFDTGTQLSFAATAGILLIHNRWLGLSTMSQRPRGFALWVWSALGISLAASLFTSPLLSHHFGAVPVGAPLYNLVAVPLLGFAFTGMWAAIFGSLIYLPLGRLLAEGANGVLALWQLLCELFASGAPVWTMHLTPLAVAVMMIMILWPIIAKERAMQRWIITLLMITSIVVADQFFAGSSNFRVWFFDVGHGDAQLWQTPAGRRILVDCGPESPSRSPGPVASYLRSRAIERLDLLVFSHLDADHIGGARAVIKQVSVATILMPEAVSSSKTWRRIERLGRRRGIGWQYAERGIDIAGLDDNCELKVVAPPQNIAGWDDNDGSLGLHLSIDTGEYGRLRLITLGDIEARGERALLQSGLDIEAGLLKVSHHGSATSTSDEFLAAVAPRLAVIQQAGRDEGGKYSVSRKVLARLRARGVEVRQTAETGALLFEAAGGEWREVDWRKPTLWGWLTGRGTG